MTNLPQWLKDNLPAIEEPYVLSYENGNVNVSYNNEIVGTFSSIIEAYDAYDSSTSFRFDESLNNQGGSLYDGMFFCNAEDDQEHARLLMAVDDRLYFSILVDSFESFLDLHEEYEANPQDWVIAYKWLELHPAFWVKCGKDKDKNTWYWTTDNIKSISYYVDRNENNEAVVLMEAGGHTEDLLYHYHDLRLDVRADSIESAYVKLAEKVNKFFNTDGTEKPNVEYEKSELELHLESLSREV